MRYCTRSQNGFTLLETVIAIGIILFGLLSILTLSTSSLVVSNVTSDEFLAANFAREGIEIAREMRDSNWLAFDTDSTTAWNANLSNGLDYTAIASVENVVAPDTYLNFTPNAFGDTCPAATGTYDCTKMWYDPTTQYYFQTAQAGFDSSAYTQTVFSRLVYLYPVCRNDSDETDEVVLTSGTCAAGYSQVGVDVRSEVQWPGRNQTVSTYSLEEYIYDWKF